VREPPIVKVPLIAPDRVTFPLCVPETLTDDPLGTAPKDVVAPRLPVTESVVDDRSPTMSEPLENPPPNETGSLTVPANLTEEVAAPLTTNGLCVVPVIVTFASNGPMMETPVPVLPIPAAWSDPEKPPAVVVSV